MVIVSAIFFFIFLSVLFAFFSVLQGGKELFFTTIISAIMSVYYTYLFISHTTTSFGKSLEIGHSISLEKLFSEMPIFMPFLYIFACVVGVKVKKINSKNLTINSLLKSLAALGLCQIQNRPLLDKLAKPMIFESANAARQTAIDSLKELLEKNILVEELQSRQKIQELYAHLTITQAQINGTLPVWQAIRLVKEGNE